MASKTQKQPEKTQPPQINTGDDLVTVLRELLPAKPTNPPSVEVILGALQTALHPGEPSRRYRLVAGKNFRVERYGFEQGQVVGEAWLARDHNSRHGWRVDAVEPAEGVDGAHLLDAGKIPPRLRDGLLVAEPTD